MSRHLAVLLLGLATAFSSTVQATPLDELGGTPVSKLEFGSFKLEVGLMGIKNWPFPIDGASVSYKLDPDRIEIIVAVNKVRAESFRTACGRTLGRVREFLYVNADGVAPMGRSFLSSYFLGPWRGKAREVALRELDADTRVRVDVIGQGSCEAALIGAPIKFVPVPSK
jgi:hypothetical protein